MKALDIVKTPKGGIALITETTDSGKKAVIMFIETLNAEKERNAWWYTSELVVIDSLPRIIAMATANPFGHGKEDVKEFF